MHVKAVLSILVAVMFSVVAQIYVKKGINLLQGVDFRAGLVGAYGRILSSPQVILGIFLYFVSVVFWLYALTRVELSYAAPFLALTYVLMVLCSWLFLGEQVSVSRWVGVIVVGIGVLIVART